MSELFCTNCGSKLEPGSVFCENCGTPVEDGVAVKDAEVPQQQRKWPIFVVIVVVLVAILIVVIVAMQNGDSTGEGKEPNGQVKTEEPSTSSTTPDEASRTASSTTIAGPPEFAYIETSSVLAPDKTTSDYSGRNVDDDILETAWNEGAPGDGTGEWIEFVAPTPQRVTTVSIVGGYPKPYRDGSDVYYKNNRPRQVTISYDGGSQTFMLQDLRGQFQTCTLAQPVETTFIRITIDSVYKGTTYDDCCIAEVKIS